MDSVEENILQMRSKRTIMNMIAICLHLYYTEMFDEISGYIDHMGGIPYDLYITMPRENKPFLPRIRERYPDANVIITENIGFDIYPFTEFLREVDLDKYDLLFKLHTKKDIPIEYSKNGISLSGSNWRYYMFNAILGSENRVKYIRMLADRHPHIGMFCAKEVLIRGLNEIAVDIDPICVEALMLECKMRIRDWEYVAGSIFAIRPHLLKPLKQRNFQADEFPPYFPRDWNGLPYCIERVLGCMVSAQGYQIGALLQP